MTLYWRELAGFFRAPIAYAVGALFLVVQGTLFWALLELLADPTRPAPVASVLPTYMGGQVLFWLIAMVVVAVASMRLFAEERRAGTWEMLMTAPVPEVAVVVAKWAAAVSFAVLLWLPTLVYPVLLSMLSDSGAGLDAGALVSSYLCLVLQIAAFTAVGAAVSAATRSQVVAAAGTVLGLAALLLVGQLPELAHWSRDDLVWRLVNHIDVRGHLLSAARGELATANGVFYSSLAAAALFVAYVLVGRGRLRRIHQRRRWLAIAPVVVIAISVNLVAARHSVDFDLSSARLSSVTPASRVVLERLKSPIDVLVVEPTHDRFLPIYGRVELVVERLQSAQPLLHVRHLDPLGASATVEPYARSFGLSVDQLGVGGMVVLRSGERRATIEVLELAGFADDDLGIGSVSLANVESAIVAALSHVSSGSVPRICFTHVHGESVSGEVGRRRFVDLERRLARDGLGAVRVPELHRGALEDCSVVAVLGPKAPLSPTEAVVLADFSRAGGGLFVAARERGGTGLELVLAELGLGVDVGVVDDPRAGIGSPQTWGTTLGHDPKHPITRRFHDRRTTVWRAPREVVAVADTHFTPLVRSSQGTPIAAAVEVPESGARAVVWGGGVGTELDPPSANAELLGASLSWLAGRELVAGQGKPEPESVRLVMGPRDRAWVFMTCVGGLPLSLVALGAFVAWRRRRVP